MFVRQTLVVVIAFAFASSGAAQDVPAATTEAEARTAEARIAEARSLYDSGADAFSRGRFSEALDYFTRAYEVSSRAELLYNIGTSHDRLGHGEAAIRNYRDYLVALPEAGNREYTEARIELLSRELEGDTEEITPARVEPAATPEPSEDTNLTPSVDARSTDGGVNVAGVALLVGAGAAGAAAVVTGILALGQRNDLESACPDLRCSPDREPDLDRLQRFTIATDVLMGLAGAAAIAGVLVFVLSDDDDDDDPAFVAGCGLTGCTGRLRF